MLILGSQWNRLAHAVVGNSLAGDVVASARFYAQLNYALSNAAIASWDSKYTFSPRQLLPELSYSYF